MAIDFGIMSARLAPAQQEMIPNATLKSISPASGYSAYDATTEGRSEPALSQFGVSLLDRSSGNGDVQGATEAVLVLDVWQHAPDRR